MRPLDSETVMHIADFNIGILGANGIVGGGGPLAVGAAFSCQYKDNKGVCACFFGDGASNQGTTQESLNMSIAPEEPRGLSLDLDPDFACRVRAAIGPGLFADVGVSRVRQLLPGDEVPVALTPCVLALDGEREVEVRRGQRACVRLSEDCLRVVDVARVMEYARQRGLFLRGAQVCYAN